MGTGWYFIALSGGIFAILVCGCTGPRGLSASAGTRKPAATTVLALVTVPGEKLPGNPEETDTPTLTQTPAPTPCIPDWECAN